MTFYKLRIDTFIVMSLVAIWQLTFIVPTLATEDAASSLRVYLGTYTGGESKGIYACQLDLRTGKLSSLRNVAECKNPSFLAISPNGRFLYAVSEISDFDGQATGAVAAYRTDPRDGSLELLNRRPSAGRGPCHIITDKSGSHVLVANYGSGSAAVLRVEPNGSLGERTGFAQHEGSSINARRQEGPHAHSINLDKANRFAFVADLGIDRVNIYRFDAVTGTITPNDPVAGIVAPGSGPRHFAFSPDGRFAYVINEMLSTVTAFMYDAQSGSLDPLQTVTTLPADFTGSTSTAEVQVHPSGKFLYGSNRGHDSIVVMKIDPQTGRLTYVEHEPTGGRTPRNFGIDPSGQFLLAANQATNNVFVFRIDRETGHLEPTGHALDVPSPVCVKFHQY